MLFIITLLSLLFVMLALAHHELIDKADFKSAPFVVQHALTEHVEQLVFLSLTVNE